MILLAHQVNVHLIRPRPDDGRSVKVPKQNVFLASGPVHSLDRVAGNLKILQCSLRPVAEVIAIQQVQTPFFASNEQQMAIGNR